MDALCELNVIEQVMNVCQTTIVQDAWIRGQSLCVHGWIYRLDDGILHDLGFCVDDLGDVSDAYVDAIASICVNETNPAD